MRICNKKEKISVKTITKDNFEVEVIKSEKPVLVDFWATWCGPCKMVGPIIDEIAEERQDIIVGKINIDEEIELAQKYGVMSIPTIIVFKDGELTEIFYKFQLSFCLLLCLRQP